MIIRDCTRAAASAFGVDVGDITRHDRRVPVVRARSAAMYLARRHGLTYGRIGLAMGGRDRKTVFAAAHRAAHLVRTDVAYAKRVLKALRLLAAVPEGEP